MRNALRSTWRAVGKRSWSAATHFAAGLVVVGVAGCGASDHTQLEPEARDPVRLHSQVSGSAADGMSLRLEGGAVVSVPPGAVAEGVTLDVRELLDTAAAPFVERLPTDATPASSPYVLTPHGTRFEQPVEVSLPIAAGLQHELLEVWWLEDESDTTWESLGLAQVLGQYAVVPMSHFSLLMLTAVENECRTANGGCDPLAACTPSVGGHSCGACPSGYTGSGDIGCTDIDECASRNGRCDPHVPCTNTPGSHFCGACPPGYAGDDATGCTDIDECAADNGGCDGLAVCTNTPGGYACSNCPLGYTGDSVQGCFDIDECATQNGGCDPHSPCTNTGGARVCGACAPGYSGDGETGCTDIDECAVDNGGCGDPSSSTCQNNEGAPSECHCIEGVSRLSGERCGPDSYGDIWQTCVSGAWQERCSALSYLGNGECRQGNGQYPLSFNASYGDLTPHTSGDNAVQARLRCEQTCLLHADWCFAIELILRDIWPTPSCSLVTDRATFQGAGNSIEHDEWGGLQSIDGDTYQTYCGGTGDCTHTSWNGGSLNPREGYHCSVMASPQ